MLKPSSQLIYNTSTTRLLLRDLDLFYKTLCNFDIFITVKDQAQEKFITGDCNISPIEI